MSSYVRKLQVYRNFSVTNAICAKKLINGEKGEGDDELCGETPTNTFLFGREKCCIHYTSNARKFSNTVSHLLLGIRRVKFKCLIPVRRRCGGERGASGGGWRPLGRRTGRRTPSASCSRTPMSLQGWQLFLYLDLTAKTINRGGDLVSL